LGPRFPAIIVRALLSQRAGRQKLIEEFVALSLKAKFGKPLACQSIEAQRKSDFLADM
jgi:hypothetical protein